MKNIIPSAARITAVGKYLVALSLSFAKAADRDDHKAADAAAPSGRRRQLHVLYLLNDLFHHTKYHVESPLAFSTLSGHIQSFLVNLLGATSAYSLEVYIKQHQRITDLLDIWERKGYFPSSFIRKLRDSASNASNAGYANRDDDTNISENAFGEERKDAPYVLPSSHGDTSTPFYDLPAGNMMPHIIPNSTKAINPKFMKALQFTAGPADENLVVAVREFLQNVQSQDIHRSEEREDAMDTDELGQSVLADEAVVKVLEGEAYYGWSKGFCQRMKSRGVELGAMGMILKRAGSDDRSQSPRKKRHYSYSGSSRSRDRSIDRSPSSSSSDQGSKRPNNQRSPSRSRNPSREQRRYRSMRSRSRSGSLSYSPPQTVLAFQRPSLPADMPPMQQAQGQGLPPPSSIPFPHPFSKGFPLDPRGVPIPPPPPPNYQGPWPPPPPPIPNTKGGNAAPPGALLPAGPKIGQSHVAPALERVPNSGFQNQTPQDFGGWTQQHLDHVSGYHYGNRGGAQQRFEGSVQNSRGRGYGRGGWNR